MDGLPDPDAKGLQGLTYPFAQAPADGQSIAVAAGVHWLRLPLQFDLDHVNIWTIDDGDGRAIIDTGLRGEETSLVRGRLFANAPDCAPSHESS